MVGRAIYKIESRGILKLLLFRHVASELWKLRHPIFIWILYLKEKQAQALKSAQTGCKEPEAVGLRVR